MLNTNKFKMRDCSDNQLKNFEQDNAAYEEQQRRNQTIQNPGGYSLPPGIIKQNPNKNAQLRTYLSD